MSVVLAVLATRAFIQTWFAVPQLVDVCQDSTGTFLRQSNLEQEQASFRMCLIARGEMFLRIDYNEVKDLSKSFLTLMTAVLVASITFSEKIVNFSSAGRWARSMMIVCWLLVFAAIVLCGITLALMSVAAGWAAYSPEINYLEFEEKAIRLGLAAGIGFCGGLAALLVAGIIAQIERSHVSRHTSLP